MRRHLFVKAILALAAIGLLAAGMRGAFQAGWWQGYQVGQTAESQEGATPYWGPRGTMPYGPGHLGSWSYGFRPFGFLRPLFTFVLLLFLFGLIAKTFGFWAWRRAWRAAGKDWSHTHPPHRHGPHHGPWPHGHPPHAPMPPWWGCACSESGTGEPADEPAEEQVAKVKPDAGEQES
jgi:hypothetical protein